MASDPTSDGPAVGYCFNCRAPCTEDDYCHGCEVLVCAQCDPYCDGPGPDHSPEDHLLYFGQLGDGAHTCRRVVGGPAGAPALCGAPAVFSAYCADHLHAVFDERAGARRPS
jgi:hypothetical protein